MEKDPEVCFARLNGEVLMTNKSEKEGINDRVQVLSRYLQNLSEEYVRKSAKKLGCKQYDCGDFMTKDEWYKQLFEREAPAFIPNDGKQTPTKGHPVFIAQHATATCCRECIRKWHKMQPGKELSQVQQDYLVDVIMTWIQREMERQ